MTMPAQSERLHRFDAAQRVSSRSIWTDAQWHFDHTRADLRRHQFRVDWAFELPDGSRFTDPRWHRWLEDARTFLWSLRVDPPVGRRQAQARSLVTVAVQLRFLICRAAIRVTVERQSG